MVGCKKYTYWFVIVITSLLSSNELWAQQHWSLSREAIDSLVHPQIMIQGEEILHFNTHSIHLGSINESDTPYVATFHFQNRSKDTIWITDVKTSCGCTQVQYPQTAILHGNEGNIKLTFDPREQIGTIDAHAYIYTNLSKTSPIVRLELTGNVSSSADSWSHLSKKMGTLRLKRKEITFKEIEHGNKTSMSILCGNSGETPLILSAKELPPYISFKTLPAVIEPNTEADMVFTLYADKLPDELKKHSSIQIVIDGTEALPNERIININININNENNL